MQQIRKKIETIVHKCQKDTNFSNIIKCKLGPVLKNMASQSMNIYEQLVRELTLCLATDFYDQILSGSSKHLITEEGYKKQISLQKQGIIKRIKNVQSVLVIQGKLREASKILNIYIAATKIAYQFLNELKQETSEQYLFKRLNLILNGKSLSSKCYKIVQTKSAHFSQGTSATKFNEHPLEVEAKNIEFKKLFLEGSKVQKKQKQIKQENKKKENQRSNSKILKLIQKVQETIKRESKRFNFLEIKPKQGIKKRIRHESVLLDLQQGQKNKRISLKEQCRRKNSIRKRVGRLNSKQNIKSRFVELRNIKRKENRSEVSDSDLSLQSIPNSNEVWFNSGSLFRVKKVLTINLPNIEKKEVQQFF